MFTPSQKMLSNYAHVLTDFALGSGEGIKKNEVIFVQFDSPALPLAQEVYRAILEKGAHPIIKMNEDSFSKIFYDVASDAQLEFFPKKYQKSLIETMDHRMYLMADRDPLYLKGVDPVKMMKANKSRKTLKKWLDQKEDAGKLTWTLCLYGTPGMAKQARLTLEEYWEQIVAACFLEEKSPIAKWQEVFKKVEQTMAKLNALPIDKLHVVANKTDLWISMGEKRKFIGGSGRNIPSFEIFTSPDWRGTNGHVYFDFPLYRYGNIIEDISLEFKNGHVVNASARKNENLIKELIKQKNADKMGEYSLTDRRFSKITKFMANTLFDENYGGEYGNTHLALGSSYHDTYTGDAKKVTEAGWAKLGYNSSAEHTDIIAKQDRMVTAVMRDGSEKVIYKGGEFKV